jgi:hypothetical protein
MRTIPTLTARLSESGLSDETMPSGGDRTHHLQCERFAESLRLVVAEVFDEATHAVVHLREDEREAWPDGEECARVWAAVREQFSRTPSADENDATAWRCELTDSAAHHALLTLIDLTDGLAGEYFVYHLELRRDDTLVLDALPHHSDAGLDASQLGETTIAHIREQLNGHAACLVSTGTHVDWVSHDRRWAISGFSLCRSTLEERRTACYGLANLRGVTRSGDGTTLELNWDPGSVSDDVIGRALTWVVDRLYSPPQTAATVEATLRDLLARYDGRCL